MRQKSMTSDEIYSLISGYAYLKLGDFRLGNDHPPLGRYIIALGLLPLDPDLPLDHPGWRTENQYSLGFDFVFHNRIDADTLLFYGRCGMVACGMLLGIFVYLWASKLFGKTSGLCALFLYAFDPNIIAHSQLCTTDMPATCFIFIAAFCFWRFCVRQTRLNLLLSTGAFALAQLAKISALNLVPIFIVLYAISYCTQKNNDRSGVSYSSGSIPAPHCSRIFSPIIVFPVMLIGSFIIIWAGYGFETEPLSFLREQIPIRMYNALPQWMRYCPVPMPNYFSAILFRIRHAAEGHAAFLMGNYSSRGWWYYFPVAFLIKTPLPTTLLLFLSFASLQRSRRSWIDELFLIVPPTVYFLTFMMSTVNIGLRHILPIYPFIFVFISQLASSPPQLSAWRRSGLFFFLVWYLYSSLSIYPHYLAYFNELIGGPTNGYNYLVDSNLDWGQDVKLLRNYLREHGVRKIWTCSFYPEVLKYYGINYEMLPMNGMPVRGWVVVSAFDLQCMRCPNKHTLDWLKTRDPLAQIGYSIFVYKID